jgi:hypothetical protein
MRVSKKALREKIIEKRGNLTRVAAAFGKSRTWLYNALNDKYPELWDDVEEARESLIDDAESELQKQMFKGNITALIFFLKTQGKTRGYVERQELTGKDGDDLAIRFVWKDGNKDG